MDDSEVNTAAAAKLLRGRRTISQASLSTEVEPDHSRILEAIDSARWAPNHHLTEPWRFYLLDPVRIRKLADMWADIQARNGASAEKVEHKRREWGESKGIVVLTCSSREGADEITRQEDYAACCCAAQNFMLHLWSEGIGSKWSTAAVHAHEDFWPLLDHPSAPERAGVVGFFFYGVPTRIPAGGRRKGVADVTVNFRG